MPSLPKVPWQRPRFKQSSPYVHIPDVFPKHLTYSFDRRTLPLPWKSSDPKKRFQTEMLKKLTRAAIIVTAISALLILLSKGIGRMLTTEGDILVWRVPFSRLLVRVPDGAGFLILLPPVSLFVVIVLWGVVAMASFSFRLMDWRFRRAAARTRANVNPSDREHAYVQGHAVQFFPVWLGGLILLLFVFVAWKLAAWGISLLH
jgi:hypothetical protein